MVAKRITAVKTQKALAALVTQNEVLMGKVDYLIGLVESQPPPVVLTVEEPKVEVPEVEEQAEKPKRKRAAKQA